MNPINGTPSGSPYLHVRGNSAYTTKASYAYRALALAFDIGFAFTLFFAAFLLTRAVPLLNLGQWILLAMVTGVLWAAQRFLLGITLGERLWDLRTQARFRLNPPILQCHPVSSTTQTIGIFLTILSFILALIAAYLAIELHPIGMPVQAVNWDAFFPDLTEAPTTASGSSETATGAAPQDRWTVIPFYYSLGAWPKSFRGHDVFYTLPYEKGPPERFAGQIIARWDSLAHSMTRLVIEGPKSPLRPDKNLYDRAEIRKCLIELWDIGLSRLPGCLALRQAVLERHIESLKGLHPDRWQLSWVKVSNRALPEDQQLQGIYFSAHNEKRGQDRFVLITARGTHQAFILDYPMNETGRAAQETFQNALRSLRVSDDLNPGKAWIDQSIAKVNLRQISQLGVTEGALHQLAEIQALLISRISVDPKTYDTYFHLAGTALMLARSAATMRKLPPPQGNPARATELLSVAKPMVQSAQRYAQDVNPKDKRGALLQNFVAETEKL